MELTPLLHRSLSADQHGFSLASDSPVAQWKKNPTSDSSLQTSVRDSNPRKPGLRNRNEPRAFNYLRVGYDFLKLGHDLQALRPRKLRKLLSSFSDGLHVFSCVEKVNIPINADFCWPVSGFDHLHHSLLGKKRPGYLCSLTRSPEDGGADSNAGYFAGQNFARMLGRSDELRREDLMCIHVSRSGGSSNGGGEGGGDDGNDDGRSEQPEFAGGRVPVLMNWHVSIEDYEDKSTHRQTDNDEMDMFERSADVAKEEKTDDLIAEFPREDFHARALQRILKDLDRLLGQQVSSFSGFAHSGEANEDLLSQNDEANSVTRPHDEVRTQGSELVKHKFMSEVKEDSGGSLLQQLQRLTLGSQEHLAVHTQIDHPIRSDMPQALQSEETRPANDDNSKYVQASREGQFLSTSPKADKEQGQRSGELQGVVGWISRLAHDSSMSHGGNHDRLESHFDEEKFRTLVNEAVASAVRQNSDADALPAPAKQADMESLKRLQRELFLELLKLREKLEQVASATHPGAAGRFYGSGKTNLQGEVNLGMALVSLEDSSCRYSRGSLEQAGMQTGVDVKLTFETPFRDKDLLITECIAGQGSTVGEGRALGGPMSLGKVQYLARLNDDVSISIVPMGARGMDVTDIVNPMQDKGLTSFSCRGPALFDHCKGSAIGVSWSGSNFALSAAQFLSGWGNQPFSMGTDARESGLLCLSTLGQLLLQPTERLYFSLSSLNRFWPSPPLPSSMGLHWSEMGPLVIPKIRNVQTSRSTLSSEDSFMSQCNSTSSHWPMLESEYHVDTPESRGTSQVLVSAAVEMEIGDNLSLGAWVQADDVHQDLEKGNYQWSVNLAKMSKSGIDWGASIGGSKPDIWGVSTIEQDAYPGFAGGVGDAYGSQLHLEAFVRLNCGKRFILQPGLLYLLHKHVHTPAFVVRSKWLF